MEIKIPDNIINIFMHGVTSVEKNVKWNGEKNAYFRPQCGIRQGGSLSLYLLLLYGKTIAPHRGSNEYQGLKSHSQGSWILHLMFEDNLLLIWETSQI